MHASHLFLLVAVRVLADVRSVAAVESSTATSVQTYTASAGFPSSLFSDYYYGASPTRQPQPKIYDEFLDYTYPLNLTDPNTIPSENKDSYVWPTAIGSYGNGSAIISDAKLQIQTILASSSGNCTKCMNVLAVGQFVAQRVPELLPGLFVDFCETSNMGSNFRCEMSYGDEPYGATWTQILALADVTGQDGQYICNSLDPDFCPIPQTIRTDTSAFFGPKPDNVVVPQASGQRVKVLHLSDMHLDSRYAIGQEANCTTGMCCRVATLGNNYTEVTVPAPTYGHFRCDSPYYLVAAALASIQPLTGTTINFSNSSLTDHFAWSIYTGDLVSHDPERQLSRNYTMYTEWSTYNMMKAFIPGGPVFAVLGNHDSSPASLDAPSDMPDGLDQQFSWNYNHVAALWQHNGWISEDSAALARTHYAGYSMNHPKYPKLRIITLNADFWYRINYYTFINSTNPDNSGTLLFLAQELQAAEDNGERAWILAHVPTGWDGTNAMPNPSDAFYQIVDRYSPHVIAAMFFGHTHEDEFMIYYANNGTTQSADTAVSVGWIGPSLTPLTNLNSGYRMYEVDTGDFNVYEAYTYFSNVSSYRKIDASKTGPVFELEYSTRDAYAISWPDDAPLNATYWHRVTEAMEANHTLVSMHNTFQGKSSVKSPNCTSDACAKARICYMRSGSFALGSQCPQGYGSVQSAFNENSAMKVHSVSAYWLMSISVLYAILSNII